MNVNYPRLEVVPKFQDRWQSVLDALRTGDFFVTTGEVLIPRFAVNGAQSGDNVMFPAATLTSSCNWNGRFLCRTQTSSPEMAGACSASESTCRRRRPSAAKHCTQDGRYRSTMAEGRSVGRRHGRSIYPIGMARIVPPSNHAIV